MGLVAEGVWFGSRGGSTEAAGAGRGGGEAVGGAGLRGWGRVVAGLVGTAGVPEYNQIKAGKQCCVCGTMTLQMFRDQELLLKRQHVPLP